MAEKEDSPKTRHTAFAELDPAVMDPKDKHKDPRKVLEPELREFMLREAVYATLPQKRAEVVMLYCALHDEAKSGAATKAVAEHLQISPATVRWHKAEAAKDQGLRKMLGLP